MFRTIPESTVWPMVRDARANLIEFLSSLDKAQWNTASLCADWRVRDVLAHLILEYHYDLRAEWKAIVASGFGINRFMRQTAIQLGSSPPPVLLERFSAMIDERHRPKPIPAVNVLADLLIHEQDIRIPLQQPKAMPQEALRLIFGAWEPGNYNLGEKITGVRKRVKGLSFQVSDLALMKGHGPVVTGASQDILMALAGRRTALDRVSGPGRVELAKRI